MTDYISHLKEYYLHFSFRDISAKRLSAVSLELRRRIIAIISERTKIFTSAKNTVELFVSLLIILHENRKNQNNMPLKKHHSKVKRIILSALAVAAIVLFIISLLINSIIATGIKSFGSKALGTKVDVDSVAFSFFKGNLEIKNLAIQNPQGYKITNAMTVGQISVNADLSSLFSDRIIINEISISNIYLDFEPSFPSGSNINDLINNVSDYEDTQKTKFQNTAENTSKKQTKLVIKSFVINNGNVVITSSLMNSRVQVSLPRIQMKELGSGGEQDAAYVLEEVLQQILNVIINASSNVGNIDIKGVPIDTGIIGKTLGNSIDSIGDEVGSIFGN